MAIDIEAIARMQVQLETLNQLVTTNATEASAARALLLKRVDEQARELSELKSALKLAEVAREAGNQARHDMRAMAWRGLAILMTALVVIGSVFGGDLRAALKELQAWTAQP